MVLVLSTFSDICTKFCQSISQGFRVMDLNSRVDMALVLSILSDNALYFSKYLIGFQSYGPEL